MLFFFKFSFDIHCLIILELPFFILSLFDEDSHKNITVNLLLKRTNRFIEEVGAINGIVTLQNFKNFFLKNGLDEDSIFATVQCLEDQYFQSHLGF